jgi:hypothetical protein
LNTHQKNVYLVLGVMFAAVAFFGLLCSGCAHQVFIHPTPIPLESPIFVTIDQLEKDYLRDPVYANAAYLGKRLIFNNVNVDEVHTLYYQIGGAVAVPMIDYFKAGGIRFQLLDWRGAQQRVQAGYILNLVGTCQGLAGDVILVNDCWAGSVEGDLGIGLPPLIQY